MLVWNASTGILALCVALLISHYLAVEIRERELVEISPPVVATVALVDFFIFVRFSESAVDLSTLGPRSVLTAILVAIVSAELLFYCQRLDFLRFGQKTYDLDPSLHLAVRAIGPAIATVTVFLLASKALSYVSLDLSRGISAGLIALNTTFDSQLPGLLIYGLLNQLLWFIGIHGPHVLENIFQALINAPGNADDMVAIPAKFFNLYVNIGGSGSTLGLLLAIFIVVRRSEAKRVAKFALLPSLFNINELVIFGLPIVFNPVYLIPFLLAPLAQIVLSYFLVHYGIVPINVVKVPWTTPPLLAGLLNSASWTGGVLQLTNIVMSALIYAPFVRFSEQQRVIRNFNDVRRIVSEIERLQLQHRSVLNRHDDIGHTARKLLHEFLQDIETEQVFLAYQPQHDRGGRVVGVEALLRWKHRNFGPISPAVICSLLEESSQINRLGRWAITTACQQLQDWKRVGILNLRMSVNLSPLQLKDTALLSLLRECLHTNGLLAHELGLELTESQHVPDDSVSVATLQELQTMGVHLEMDDFGMGYSSMLYIQRFHFDAIKLDGSLTKEILKDNNCGDIIRSVVQLARVLGMRVVAEYVETAEQQAVLESLGCDAFQGYLYSPALPGSQCLQYLQNQTVARASVAHESLAFA